MSKREGNADRLAEQGTNAVGEKDSISRQDQRPSGGFARDFDDLWQHSLEDLSNLAIDGRMAWIPVGPEPLIISPRTQIVGGVAIQLDTGFQGEGPDSGQVTDIAIDPRGDTDRTLYIATGGGGIWKTIDGGQHWSATSDFLRSLSMGAVAVDPTAVQLTDPQVVYAGTGNLFDPGRLFARGIGIFKSIDGGSTWAHLDGGIFATIFNRIAINTILVLASDVLLVATNQGLFRSVDGGLNFGDNSPGFNNGLPFLHGHITTLRQDTADPDIVYAAASGFGVFRLSGRGAAVDRNLFTGQFEPQFRPIVANLPNARYQPNAGKGQFDNIAFTQSTRPNNQTMYASVQRGPLGAGAVYIGLFKSTDGGATWTVMPQAKQRIDQDGAAQTSNNLTVGVDPKQADIVFVGSQQLWCSTDGGTTFDATPCTRNEVHLDHHALVFSPETHWDTSLLTSFYVGTDGGIARSDNAGLDWNNINSGIGTSLVRGIDIGRGPGNNDFTYCGMHDTGNAEHRPTDAAFEFHSGIGGGGDGSAVAVDPADPLIAYAFNSEAFVKTVNGGLIWFESNKPANPAIVIITGASVGTPIVITTQSDHPYQTGDQVTVQGVKGNVTANRTSIITRVDQRHFSLNGATGVTAYTGDGVATGPSIGRNLTNFLGNRVRRVALEQTNPATHTRVVYVSEADVLHRSDDAGITFRPLRDFDQTITALATTSLDPNRLWVGLVNGLVHFSADRGATWDAAPFRDSPGGVGAVEEIAVDPTNVSRVAVVYSAQSGGNAVFRTRRCYLTSNNGQTWEDSSGTDGSGPTGNLPDLPLHSVVWDSSTNPPTLIVASDAGVMRSTDLGASWQTHGVDLPAASCQSLAIDNSVAPRVLRVGAYGRSCFELQRFTGPNLSIKGNLGFGAVASGRSGELRAQLFNTGDADLEITNIARNGDSDFQITPAPALPLKIEPGGQQSLVVRFQPSSAGDKFADFEITSNDAISGLRSIFASGWNVAAPTTPRLAVNASLGFGTVKSPANRALPLLLINTGLGRLEIRKISRTGGSSDFEAPTSALTFPFELQPGDKLDLEVRFKPTSNGDLEATFDIESNDPVIRGGKAAGTRTIKATGKGESVAGSNLKTILIIAGIATAVIGGALLINELDD